MPELSRIERPSVRVTRTLLSAVEKRMAELFDARFNADDVPLTRDALVAAMADCDVLVPTVTDSIDASIIAAAPPRLKLIASYGAGVNHIDLAAAKAKGIMVTNTPGVFTDDTADLTMALILNVPRRLGEGHRAMRNGPVVGDVVKRKTFDFVPLCWVKNVRYVLCAHILSVSPATCGFARRALGIAQESALPTPY